ncbi:MAG: insulinase family protein [Spirochaetales bacterium]|nr:insulinase family protein [Spirochaetales bacterium]
MNKLKINDRLHGFVVTGIEEISEYRGIGLRLTHEITGLDLYHLHNDDKENFFSFVFKTPSDDNTGVAHILEHCVLAGSKKYPVKDPFLSMMNGSMNTFMNAMTYPDKTVYPAASMVKKDYLNLMSVYADAVFFPLLREEIFMQEGIRFEPLEDGSTAPGGVVFNEMKGAYSNHDSITAEYSYRHLFPETVYRFDSGGEPSVIPSLSYKDFLNYHRRFYHPSNCRIFLYGDIETEEQLKFLGEEVLSAFSGRADPAEDVQLQESWTSPRRARATSPMAEEGDDDSDDENSDDDATITLNWKCGSTEESVDLLKFEVLAEALLGNMGAPLYKAVVESGIGEDVSPVSGLDTDLREIVFSVGVRGADIEKESEFEELIMNEFRQLVKSGIPSDVLGGALHKVEFRNREIKGGAPFGLRLMSRSLKGWLHGADPSRTMGFEEPMKTLRAELAVNPRCFEDMIDKRFINNSHRLILSVEPDTDHNSRMEEEITGSVEAARKALSADELEDEKRKFELFRKFQDNLDTVEALSVMPVLGLEDLPHEIRTIATVKTELMGAPLYLHDLFTNGIVYIDFAIDIRDISDEQAMLLPFLSRMICSSGLPGMSYDQVALQLALKTGGLYTFLESSRTAGDRVERKDYLFFRLKTLEQDLDESWKLASDLFLHSEISDPERVKDLLLEMKNDFKSSIIPSGHSYCAVKAGAEFDRVMEREDEWRGSRQLLYLNDLTASAEQKIPEICGALEELRGKLFCKNRFAMNITCSGDYFEPVKEKLSSFMELLPEGEVLTYSGPDIEKTPSFHLGSLSVPSSVCFSAVTMPAAFLGTDMHSWQSLLAHLMKTNELWEEVRMKNGAYGVYASVNGTEGLMTVSTYRDPEPGKNLSALSSALRSAAAGRYSESDLMKAVITVVGRDMKPMSPAEESLIGFRRELYLITDEIRQEKREAMLSCSTGNLVQAASALIDNLPKAVSIVMGPEDVLKKIASEYGSGILENKTVLPL